MLHHHAEALNHTPEYSDMRPPQYCDKKSMIHLYTPIVVKRISWHFH